MNQAGSVILVLLMIVCLSLGSGCSQPRVELVVASQPNVNPDHSNRPSPVIVKIYELRNDLAFKQAEFALLFDNPLQVLGADLLAADELVFIPGEARRVAYQPDPGTRFVGIVAGFRQMDRALWRAVKPVDPEGENWFAFELNDATILIVPDEDAEDWDPEQTVRQFQQRLHPPRQSAAGGRVPADSGTQPGSTAPAGSAPPGAQPSQDPLSAALDDAAREADSHAGQAKEVITVINQQGIETLPGGKSPLAVPAVPVPAVQVPAVQVPAEAGAPASTLPVMRPF
jgi:type VI secretion system protein VasD